MPIQHYRLINGDEIIGDNTGETPDEVLVSDPYIVSETQTSIVLLKFLPYAANQTIALKKSHVIVSTDLHAQMIRYYHNTVSLGRSATATSMEQLAEINDQMEEYIHSGRVMPTSDAPVVDLSVHANYPSSNTVH